MRSTGTLAIVLSLFAPAAYAGCEAPQTQMDMNACAARDLAEATREINATYKSLMSRLPTDDQAKVRNVQLKWIAFKDANCRFESSYAEGGSMQPLIRDTCLATLTRARSRELKQWLKLFGQ